MHYYNRLTGEQKKIYKTIVSGISAFSEKIKIPLRPINELSMIYDCIQLDNPLLFYVSSFSCQNDLYTKISIIFPEYTHKRPWVKKYTDTAMNTIMAFDAVRGKSDFEKELHVHDYCLANFTYDYNPDDHSHTILGPILRNTGVCEGIAKYVKLALDHLGVKNLIVSGKAKNPLDDMENEYHAWNIVDVEGEKYHLDVTLDLTLKEKMNRHDYFNLSDSDIKKDHTIIGVVPACSMPSNDYYSINSMLARSPADIERHIVSNLRKGQKDIIVKLLNAQYSQRVVDKIFKIAQHQYRSIQKSSGAVEISCNANQMVFEISFK